MFSSESISTSINSSVLEDITFSILFTGFRLNLFNNYSVIRREYLELNGSFLSVDLSLRLLFGLSLASSLEELEVSDSLELESLLLLSELSLSLSSEEELLLSCALLPTNIKYVQRYLVRLDFAFLSLSLSLSLFCFESF